MKYNYLDKQPWDTVRAALCLYQQLCHISEILQGKRPTVTSSIDGCNQQPAPRHDHG